MVKLKNLLLKALNLLSILIILLSIFVMLTVVMTKSGEAPNFMGYSLFRVLTGSMEPTLPTNSLIVVKKVEPSELSVGDVISFYSRDPALMGSVNTHRIIAVELVGEEFEFVTKGDANNVKDQYGTRTEDVIGKVVYSSKTLGKVVRLLSNPLVFVPIILVPLAILLGRSLWESIALAQKLAREEEEAAVREAVENIRKRHEIERQQTEMQQTEMQQTEMQQTEMQQTEMQQTEMQKTETQQGEVRGDENQGDEKLSEVLEDGAKRDGISN